MKKKDLHEANLVLETHLSELGLVYDKEYQFCPPRKWKSDYRITNVLHGGQMVLIEIEGGNLGTYDRFGRWRKGEQGRHNRAAGFQGDMEKYNKAAMLGYALLRFSTQDVLRGRAKDFLQKYLTSKENA